MFSLQNGGRIREEGAHEKEGAIVVGCMFDSAEEDAELVDYDLEELCSLLKTLGVEVKDQVVQRRAKPNPSLLLGSGKVEEIKALAEVHRAAWVVFDHHLSGPQVRNLEKELCLDVLDRSGVILEIFSRHARTKQAKLQVEIAQLEYLMPRLTGAWTHFQRQTGGGVRARGMGEKQIEIDRRRARERIARLAKQLAQIRKERQTQSKSRQNELRVGLVGYTNSGKTTLMSTMTRSQASPEDALFATLDSSVRSLDPSTRPRILLSDTVGFIRKLPPSLIESFKSTLEEVVEADLLLHVVDLSHPNYRNQMATTEQVLADLGAQDIPVLMVFNKADQVSDPLLTKIVTQGFEHSMCLSALDKGQVRELRSMVYRFFESCFKRVKVRVSGEDAASLSVIHQHCVIMHAEYEEDGSVVFDVRASESSMAKLSQHTYVK